MIRGRVARQSGRLGREQVVRPRGLLVDRVGASGYVLLHVAPSMLRSESPGCRFEARPSKHGSGNRSELASAAPLDRWNFPSGPALHRSRIFALAHQPTSCQQPAPGFVLQAAPRERAGRCQERREVGRRRTRCGAGNRIAPAARDRTPSSHGGHSVLVSPWRWRRVLGSGAGSEVPSPSAGGGGMAMTTILVIAAAALCCGLCVYGISRAVGRSVEGAASSARLGTPQGTASRHSWLARTRAAAREMT